MLDFTAAVAPKIRYEREPRTLIPQIRKMLRQQPVMSRETMREDLRARGRIGMCGFGGRRLYNALHWLADCGEVLLEPDRVIAVNLARPRSERPAGGSEFSSRSVLIEAARKRESRLARRSKAGSLPKPVKGLCTIS